jgi:hypothetical protein
LGQELKIAVELLIIAVAVNVIIKHALLKLIMHQLIQIEGLEIMWVNQVKIKE